MNISEPQEFSFEWFNDFRIRCARGVEWVDFRFEIGGGVKDLGIGRTPCGTTKHVSDGLVDAARTALGCHLESVGYEVTLLDY